MTLEDNSFTSEVIPNIELEIPLFLQYENYSSVPCCIKMALDYYSSKYVGIDTINLQDISEAIGTTELGTCYDRNLENINKLVEKSDPLIEFTRDLTYPTWNSIVSDMKKGNLVILWVKYIDDSERYFTHSIILRGVDNEIVKYNDPIFGIMSESLGSLLEKWEAVDRYAIRIKIGERKSRKITEYSEIEKNNNE